MQGQASPTGQPAGLSCAAWLWTAVATLLLTLCGAYVIGNAHVAYVEQWATCARLDSQQVCGVSWTATLCEFVPGIHGVCAAIIAASGCLAQAAVLVAALAGVLPATPWHARTNRGAQVARRSRFCIATARCATCLQAALGLVPAYIFVLMPLSLLVGVFIHTGVCGMCWAGLKLVQPQDVGNAFSLVSAVFSTGMLMRLTVRASCAAINACATWATRSHTPKRTESPIGERMWRDGSHKWHRGSPTVEDRAEGPVVTARRTEHVRDGPKRGRRPSCKPGPKRTGAARRRKRRRQYKRARRLAARRARRIDFVCACCTCFTYLALVMWAITYVSAPCAAVVVNAAAAIAAGPAGAAAATVAASVQGASAAFTGVLNAAATAIAVPVRSAASAAIGGAQAACAASACQDRAARIAEAVCWLVRVTLRVAGISVPRFASHIFRAHSPLIACVVVAVLLACMLYAELPRAPRVRPTQARPAIQPRGTPLYQEGEHVRYFAARSKAWRRAVVTSVHSMGKLVLYEVQGTGFKIFTIAQRLRDQHGVQRTAGDGVLLDLCCM